MKTGTITDSTTIVTGLSSITQFVIYIQKVESAGLMVGHYNKELGMHYTYCSTYDTLTTIASGTTTPTIDGGTVTWPGTIGTDKYAPAAGVEYTWIAIGEQ